MSRNSKLVKSLSEIARRNREEHTRTANNTMVPYVYAALAIALHRQYGWGYTRITRVFGESQRIWEEYQGELMLKLCEEEVGIALRNGDEND